MQERILEFSNILRKNGIRVSLSETMDAFKALDLVGIENLPKFKSALRATLIKRTPDLKAFDDLFDLYFLRQAISLNDTEQAMMSEMGLSPKAYQELIEQMERLLRRMEEEISQLARALLGGDMARVDKMILEAMLQENFSEIQGFNQVGEYFRRVTLRLAADRVRAELEMFKQELRRLGENDPAAEQISRYIDRRLSDLSERVRNLIEREIRKNQYTGWDRERLEYLWEKNFSYYTEEDVRKMKEVVARLARRFKNLLTVRRKKDKRGRFNVKHTLRRSLQYGGVPFRILLDRRKREKPQVLILCDISDSVLNASRFMLHFVYSMQDLYGKVRSFVFVSDIDEATALFGERGLDQAIDAVLNGGVVNVYAHSNFGRAFKTFYDRYRSAVTGKTTVLILGDGRNNYNPHNDWVLREIQQRAKRVIWLNPEGRPTWGIGDSEMPRYARYCDITEECKNFRQLNDTVDRLIR